MYVFLLTINLSQCEANAWFRTADGSREIFCLSQGGNPTQCIRRRSSYHSIEVQSLGEMGLQEITFMEEKNKLTSGYWPQVALSNFQK